MSVWQSIALGFLATALAGLQAAIKNPESRKKYRSACLMVVQAAKVIRGSFPGDPEFE